VELQDLDSSIVQIKIGIYRNLGLEVSLRGAGSGLFIKALLNQSFTERSRSAFPITEIELKLIARAAIIGLRRIPVKG